MQHQDELFDSDFVESANVTEELLFEKLKQTIEDTVVGFYDDWYRSSRKIPFVDAFPHQQFGLYGVDVALLSDGSMRVFEYNLGPDLNLANQVDKDVKYPMVKQALSIVGIRERPFRANLEDPAPEIAQQYEKIFPESNLRID